MGCGSSNNARNDDPPIDPITVTDLDPSYPPPKPPQKVKDDVFQLSDAAEVDAKAKQNARAKLNTYEELSQALTIHCSTDLLKVRAIFVWLFHQDIYGSFYSGVVDPHTPRGYMKLIKAGKGTYETFFALLCRTADIPCNVIRGFSKGDDYEVGQHHTGSMEGAWCAVHVGGDWRLVHPLWAHFNEKLTYTNNKKPPRAGSKRPAINEFYWLTDPMKMVCFHWAKTDAWQLLKTRWDQKKYLDSPQFTEDYFTSKLMLPRKYTAIINSDNGICLIDLDHEEFAELEVSCDVTRNSGDRRKAEPDRTQPDDDSQKNNTKNGGNKTPKDNRSKTNKENQQTSPRKTANDQVNQDDSELFTKDHDTTQRNVPPHGTTLRAKNDNNKNNHVKTIEGKTIPPNKKPKDGDTNNNVSQDQDEGPKNVNMSEYIAIARSSNKKTVLIRLPYKGRYNAEVFGGGKSSSSNQSSGKSPQSKQNGGKAQTASKSNKIVEFRLECAESIKDPQPFPLLPKEGFGLSAAAEGMGISESNPDSGLVTVKRGEQIAFSFTSTQALEAKATLVHVHCTDPAMYEENVRTDVDDSGIVAVVGVPHEPVVEFGLQISARPLNSKGSFTPIGTYLLVDENWRKKTAVVAPTMGGERLRRLLIGATEKSDIDKLESAILDFQRASLPDNGDLTKAKERLVELHLRNLSRATKNRKLEDLVSAVDAARKSCVAEHIVNTKEMADAEAARRQLGRLKLYMHKVMELNQKTISEMHSYARPRPLVHNVMKATFRLLGEPRKKVQDWGHLRHSLRTLGRESVINRVRRRDFADIKDPQINDAQKYLENTNKVLVRLTSAGAGTFFIWSNNMIAEFQGKGKLDPTQIWGNTPRKDPWAREPRHIPGQHRGAQQDPGGRSLQQSPRKFQAQHHKGPGVAGTTALVNKKRERDAIQEREEDQEEVAHSNREASGNQRYADADDTPRSPRQATTASRETYEGDLVSTDATKQTNKDDDATKEDTFLDLAKL